MPTVNHRLLFSAVIVLIASLSPAFGQGRCSWTVPPPATITFGTYSVFNLSPIDLDITATVRCNPNTTGTLTFTQGTNSSSYARTMLAGGNLLPYNIYRDGGHSEILGDGTGGSVTFPAFLGEPQNKEFPIVLYSRLIAGADVPPGTYNDSITATLTWGPGGSQVDTRTIGIQAIVAAQCIGQAFTLNFGTYDPLVTHRTSPLDASTAVNVFCTKGTSANVSLSSGSNALGSQRQTRLGASNYLLYEIYLDSARTTPWDTVNVNTATSATRNIALGPGPGFLAYGRIPGGQDVTVGSYTDTITATINY